MRKENSGRTITRERYDRPTRQLTRDWKEEIERILETEYEAVGTIRKKVRRIGNRREISFDKLKKLKKEKG